MLKFIEIALILVFVSVLAACGSSSSSSPVTDYTLSTSVPKPSSPVNMGGAIQGGGALAFSSYSVSTFTGTVAGFSNHSTNVSPPAKFNRPLAVTSNGSSVFVADYQNNVIRQIDATTGLDRTIAGSPFGFAGAENAAAGGVATFNLPRDITTDGTNLYVADSGNYVIRKIVIATGEVTTIAGAAGQVGYADNGVGVNARFNVINGITTDGQALFVTDSGFTIRRIDLLFPYRVTTLAGAPGKSGSAGGTQGAARFKLPNRITTDGPNLYVTDFNDGTIRKIVISTGEVSTIAGISRPDGYIGAHVDSVTSGDIAQFFQPNGITCDGVYLYVTDSYDHTVRRITLTAAGVSGPVSTIAGISPTGPITQLTLFPGASDGRYGVSTFNRPIGLTSNGVNLFVSDNQNNRIRKIQ